MFGFLRRRKAKKEPLSSDPLAAYDRFLSELEAQGAQIRRSAATLVAVRSELTRDEARLERVLKELEARAAAAAVSRDEVARGVLARDRNEAQASLAATRESLAQAEEDAKALLQAGEELAGRVADLKRERASAHARLAVGTAISGALRERQERFEQVMALDAARDEIERAHALAQIYREDRAKEK